MTQDITSLIEKLEGAEVGSRELDCAIYEIQNPSHIAVKGQSGRYYDPKIISALGAEKYITRGTYVSPKYSVSLDAALALAERVLTGVRIVIDSSCKETGKPAAGFVFGQTDERINGVMNDGSTLPLALCAAILRAQSEAR